MAAPVSSQMSEQIARENCEYLINFSANHLPYSDKDTFKLLPSVHKDQASSIGRWWSGAFNPESVRLTLNKALEIIQSEPVQAQQDKKVKAEKSDALGPRFHQVLAGVEKMRQTYLARDGDASQKADELRKMKDQAYTSWCDISRAKLTGGAGSSTASLSRPASTGSLPAAAAVSSSSSTIDEPPARARLAPVDEGASPPSQPSSGRTTPREGPAGDSDQQSLLGVAIAAEAERRSSGSGASSSPSPEEQAAALPARRPPSPRAQQAAAEGAAAAASSTSTPPPALLTAAQESDAPRPNDIAAPAQEAPTDAQPARRGPSTRQQKAAADAAAAAAVSLMSAPPSTSPAAPAAASSSSATQTDAAGSTEAEKKKCSKSARRKAARGRRQQ